MAHAENDTKFVVLTKNGRPAGWELRKGDRVAESGRLYPVKSAWGTLLLHLPSMRPGSYNKDELRTVLGWDGNRLEVLTRAAIERFAREHPDVMKIRGKTVAVLIEIGLEEFEAGEHISPCKQTRCTPAARASKTRTRQDLSGVSNENLLDLLVSCLQDAEQGGCAEAVRREILRRMHH